MKSRKISANGMCPAPETVLAFVMEGCDEVSGLDVGRHVERCEACRRLAMDMHATFDLLRMDGDLPIRDLTVDVMGRLPPAARPPDGSRSRRGKPSIWRAPLRIAAALAILLGTAHLARHMFDRTADFSMDPVSAAVRGGRTWLLEHQLLSGGWDAEMLGGRPAYAEALTGLAVLAVAVDDSFLRSTEFASLRQAADFLLERQAESGLISLDANAAMYNHGIATLALLRIHGLVGDERLKPSIDKALAFICDRQSAFGGWGYHNDRDSPPNTSITAWQVKALLQARAQGWSVPLPVLRNALAWMEGTVGPQGYFGYERPQQYPEGPAALTMMGAYCLFAASDSGVTTDPRLEDSIRAGVIRLASRPPDDYYQTYFYASAMDKIEVEALMPEIRRIEDALMARQVNTGGDAGAWLADGDRWEAVGGKLYSTAMAMLALDHPERTDVHVTGSRH